MGKGCHPPAYDHPLHSASLITTTLELYCFLLYATSRVKQNLSLEDWRSTLMFLVGKLKIKKKLHI